LGLDDRETYLAILDDLKAQKVKISVHWDLLEKKDDKFDFSELDWQMAEAEKRNVQVLLAVGMRTPRWPECHIPDWAKNMTKEEQEENIWNDQPNSEKIQKFSFFGRLASGK